MKEASCLSRKLCLKAQGGSCMGCNHYLTGTFYCRAQHSPVTQHTSKTPLWAAPSHVPHPALSPRLSLPPPEQQNSCRQQQLSCLGLSVCHVLLELGSQESKARNKRQCRVAAAQPHAPRTGWLFWPAYRQAWPSSTWAMLVQWSRTARLIWFWKDSFSW